MRRIAIPSFLVVASLLFALPPSIARSQPGRNPLDDRASLALPGMESVHVDTGIVFLEAPGAKLAFDLFHPVAATGRSHSPQGRRAPLVVFVNGVGIADPPLRRWGGYQSWGRLVAMSGMAAVTHDSRRETPREDLEALIAHLRRNAERYGIDPENIAIWASSANLRHGSWYALNPANKHVKAAAFYYGGIDTTYLRGDLPVFVARAGLDFQGTNAGMDGFVARSLARNAPVTVVNLPNGRHGFDVTDPEEASRDVIRSTMAFLRANLSPEMQEARHAR
ncbi:MAG TPA: hypothetical protein VI198_04110, partial [Candidatus Eisenbacteria bacterium]